MNNRDKQILKRVLKYCNQIQDTVERFGDSYIAKNSVPWNFGFKERYF